MSDAPDEDRLEQQLEIVRSLLAHGAKLDARDQNGKTAYDLAASPQFKSALEIKVTQPQ